MFLRPALTPVLRRAFVEYDKAPLRLTLDTNVPECLSPPFIFGSADIGGTLICHDGTWEHVGEFTYQWQADEVSIPGATENRYIIPSDAAGKVITCAVTGTSTGGTHTVVSNALLAGLAPPVNTVAPAVTGVAEESGTLTCSNGTWTGTSITYSYQWESNGVPFAGAINSTLVLGSEHKGKPVYCVVTATNSGGAVPQASNTVDVSPFPVVTTWNYVTPEIGNIPAPGTIVHPSNFVTKMNVSLTNLSGNPVNLSSLGPGDTISFNGQTYVVQAPPQFFAEYAAVSIEPGVQQPNGTYEVTVEDFDASAGTYMPNDMDGDGKLDTVLHAGAPRVSIDSDSINIDVNNDGKLDFTIPL